MDYHHVELYYDYFNKHSKKDYEQYKDSINDALSATERYYDGLIHKNPKINKKDYQKAFEHQLFYLHLPHDVYTLAVKSLLNLIDKL